MNNPPNNPQPLPTTLTNTLRILETVPAPGTPKHQLLRDRKAITRSVWNVVKSRLPRVVVDENGNAYVANLRPDMAPPQLRRAAPTLVPYHPPPPFVPPPQQAANLVAPFNYVPSTNYHHPFAPINNNLNGSNNHQGGTSISNIQHVAAQASQIPVAGLPTRQHDGRTFVVIPLPSSFSDGSLNSRGRPNWIEADSVDTNKILIKLAVAYKKKHNQTVDWEMFERLPGGYRIYCHNRHTKRGPKKNLYFVGHRKAAFNSFTKFFVHFDYMMTNHSNAGCACALCKS